MSSNFADSLLHDDKSEVPQIEQTVEAQKSTKSSHSTLLCLPLIPHTLRRSTRELTPDTIDWVINNHSLKWRLITMVRYVGTNNITEEQVINLIKKNPGKSNPFCDSHKSFLIALASRDNSNLNIVSAILEYNPTAINCLSAGRTPLDEATDFRQFKMIDLLREKGGLTKIELDTIHELSPPPLRREPRVMDPEIIKKYGADT